MTSFAVVLVFISVEPPNEEGYLHDLRRFEIAFHAILILRARQNDDVWRGRGVLLKVPDGALACAATFRTNGILAFDPSSNVGQLHEFIVDQGNATKVFVDGRNLNHLWHPSYEARDRAIFTFIGLARSDSKKAA
jgi:hypothetical protein